LTSVDADLVVIDGAGHMVPYEQSDAVIAAVTGFVDE
jgi:pimeloyl-ACP methyl ester carboxylesterase